MILTLGKGVLILHDPEIGIAGGIGPMESRIDKRSSQFRRSPGGD